MTWPGAGSGADSCDCLFLRAGGGGGGTAPRLPFDSGPSEVPLAGGRSLRYRRRGLPGTLSVSSAWRYEAARGCAMPGAGRGGRGVPASGCSLASVTPVCQRLISFPTARPLGFVVGFYFLISFLPPPPASRTRAAHVQRDTRVCAHTRTALPSAPREPRGTPRLCTATSWGVCPPPPFLILPRLSGAATRFWPVTSPPHLQAGLWAGRQTPVSGAQRRHSAAACPPPRRGRPDPAPPKPLLLQARGPTSGFSGCCAAKVGVFKPLSQDSQPETLLPTGTGLCRTRRDGDAGVAASPHPGEGLRILGVGKVYSGYFLSFPGSMRCWWPRRGERWGCPCPSGDQSEPPPLPSGLLPVGS